MIFKKAVTGRQNLWSEFIPTNIHRPFVNETIYSFRPIKVWARLTSPDRGTRGIKIIEIKLPSPVAVL